MAPLTEFEQDVRGAATRLIAETGRMPSSEEIAKALDVLAASIDAALRRLAEAHALLLHPNSTRLWVVHPFALTPGGCWVETPRHGYWANCVYCGFGIAAAMSCDAVVTTRLGGESQTVRYEVKSGAVVSDHVFHLSTPVARWWDNVIFACASFQPFATTADADAWCKRHGLPRGATMTIPELWSFASDWYGGYLDDPWRKRSPEAVRALFARHGLTDPFWEI